MAKKTKTKGGTPLLTCRFYETLLPEVEDVVVAKVHKIADSGAYVHLTEYDDHEAMIPISELSRVRIRSVNKHIKVGRSEYAAVIRLDQAQKYVDISKSKVYRKDLLACEDRFGRGKVVNSILRNVASYLGYKEKAQLEALYEKTAWRFDRKAGHKSASFNFFKRAIDDPSVFNNCELSDAEKQALIEEVKKRLSPQSLKIRADVEVSCFESEGVEAVKRALMEGKKGSFDEEKSIQINLIAAPLFSVTTTNMKRDEGIRSIEIALQAIKSCIESAGGNFKVESQPEVVSDLDDREMRKRAEMLDVEVGSADGDYEDEGDDNEEQEPEVKPGPLPEEACSSSSGDDEGGEKADIITVQELHKQLQMEKEAEKDNAED